MSDIGSALCRGGRGIEGGAAAGERAGPASGAVFN